jgi:arylformamidase
VTAELRIAFGGRQWIADMQRAFDLSLPLDFAGSQPTFFTAPRASASAYTVGSFVGDVARGGSCNCSTYTLTPHCNGTHTECVGHITREPVNICDVAPSALQLAKVVTVATTRAIERSHLESVALESHTALVVRTLPNDATKLGRDYDREPQVHFDPQAMQWVVEHGIEHLVTDLPSVDPAHDEGALLAHRIFWGLPERETSVARAKRRQATITELAFIDSTIVDGDYLLNLQVAPFLSDAAPSRPLLYPLTPQ